MRIVRVCWKQEENMVSRLVKSIENQTNLMGHVVLVFQKFWHGDAVEIDCDLPNAVPTSGKEEGAAPAAGNKKNTAIDATNRLRKERLLWSLL